MRCPVLPALLLWTSLFSREGEAAIPMLPTLSRDMAAMLSPAEVSLSASGLQTLERSLASVLPTQIDSARSFVDNLQASERDFLASGVDRPVDSPVGSRESFANHLATSSEALEIGVQGELFLKTTNDTAARLNVAVQELEVGSSGESLRRPLRPFCPFSLPLDCSGAAGSRYRTIDGSCNNVANPYWGKAFTPFERLLPPLYEDFVSAPRSTSVFSNQPLPGARQISTGFHENSVNSDLMQDTSHMSMEFGQFVSHDIQRNALSKGYLGSNIDCCAQNSRFRRSCLPIDIPSNDPHYSAFGRTCMNFVRAVPTPNLACTLGPRQQLNQNTHYLDASQVYGSDKATSDSLRTFVGGELKTSTAPGINDLLPKDTNNDANCILPADPNVKCFKTGDVRSNQQPALITLHTVFMREHNRIARKLAEINDWDDQTLYEESRKIVGAILQHITYKEYLQDILGNDVMTAHALKPQTAGYFTGYDVNQNGAIVNGFSAAAFRFGHSMVRRHMASVGGSTPNPLLKNVFLDPSAVYDTSGGIDGVTKGLTGSLAQKTDRKLTDQLTNHLFERSPGFGNDLAATNVQRGRDHGIPFYLMWRAFCNQTGMFDHDPLVITKLLATYGNPVDIDLFTGGVSETPVPGGKVGPTFACIIARQFLRLKTGDRFYYENNGAQSFELGQLGEIRKQTMSKVLCRNTGIPTMRKNAFLTQLTISNPQITCSSQADLDFDQWRCAGWNPWGAFTSCFNGFKFRLRSCRTTNPKPCASNPNPCPGDAFELVFCFSSGGFASRSFASVGGIQQSQIEANIRRLLSSQSNASMSADDILKTAVSEASSAVRREPRLFRTAN